MHLLGEEATWDPFPGSRRHDDGEDRRAAHRAAALSAVGLGLAGLVEIVIAVLSGSVGLLGDALHNLSDVSTSAVVLGGFRISRRPASSSHPYGWERAEDLAGLGVAAVVWLSALFAGVASYHKFTRHGGTSHVGVGIAAAAVGIAANRIVARYKSAVGRRIQSTTLVADARHSELDAVSSAGALLGLVGVAAGWRSADAIAGLVVTWFIVRVGWEITGEMVQHLMDGVDPSDLSAAERAAGDVPAVHHAHVRARWMGRSLVVEVEGFVDPELTVAEGEQIGRAVEDAVYSAVPKTRAVVWCPRAMATI